jgi:hypothetical protein
LLDYILLSYTDRARPISAAARSTCAGQTKKGIPGFTEELPNDSFLTAIKIDMAGCLLKGVRLY